MNEYLTVLLVLILTLAAIITLAAWTKRGSVGATSLIGFSLSLAAWVIVFTLFFYAPQPWMVWLLNGAYLFSSISRLYFFLFTIRYSRFDQWMTPRVLALFLVVPFLTQVILATNRLHGFFYARTTLHVLGSSVEIGPWFWINAVYNYSLLLAGILFISQAFLRQSRINHRLIGLLLLGTISPVVVYLATLAGSAIIPGAELSPAVFLLPALILVIGLLPYRLLEHASVNRDSVIEVMNDAWMVLDEKNQVIDMNAEAELLVNRSRQHVFGLPMQEVLTDWPNVVNQMGSSPTNLDANFSMETKNLRRYFNLRVQPLPLTSTQLNGHVIIWRDITRQKMAEDARRLAREEMFMLLHGLSGAASEASSLNAFLSDSMYLITSAFQCQSMGIFLLDESQEKDETPRMSLVSQVGLSEIQNRKLARLQARTRLKGGLMQQVLVNKVLFTSPRLDNDEKIPGELREIGPGSLLAAPLRSTDQVLGLIFLVRKEGSLYTPEEEARFTAAAEEVSNFIYNDRQRQLAIALAERARLVRDLHDSVTQKLYGLLALTEAAQAGLEVGSTEMSTRVLTPIGENARQALKEMRLFLYELTPSPLKKDGLVAALNQRLDMVEGRADIQRKIDIDESIYLTSEQQVAIFFIAQ